MANMLRQRMMLRAQPSRIINMQQRFMSFKPTAKKMSPVPVCTGELRIYD
jgi:hypothetical protein